MSKIKQLVQNRQRKLLLPRLTKKGAMTHSKILLSAVCCLVKYGYYRTNIAVVAKDAGVTRASILHYFPTLDDLLSQTIEYVIMTLRERQDGAPNIVGPGEQFEASVERLKARDEPGYMVAWIELIAAARTDHNLRSLVVRGVKQLDRGNLKTESLLSASNTNTDPEEFRIHADALKLYRLSMAFADILIPHDTDFRIRDVVDMWKDDAKPPHRLEEGKKTRKFGS